MLPILRSCGTAQFNNRMPKRARRRRELAELARLFARLSVTAFGGPAAHVALMRRELVERRDWLTDAEFLDLLGASNVIPGPTSTEVAMYVGRRRAGLAGLLVCGVAFIGPAAVIVGILAVCYRRYGTTPAVGDLFDGIKPVVVAIVAIAVIRLSQAAIRSRTLAVIAVVVLALYLAGINEPALLLAAAAVAALATGRPRPDTVAAVAFIAVPTAAGAAHTEHADIPRIFAVFFKIGALLFGSGYVLLAFLRRDLVISRGWLTNTQLLDAIAVGQFTPGPLFTTATFVGYLLAGIPGAIVATVAIFLPSFLMVAALEPVVARMRRSSTTAAALDGLNAGAVALMAGVTWFLGRDAVVDLPTGLIAVAAAVSLIRWKLSPGWMIAAGAVCGLLLHAR